MKFTDPEWQIMNALWQKNPVTAREIIELIPGDVKWAYTTVKTMLSRLVVKEAVSEKKRGNTSLYSPRIAEKNARNNALKSVFDRVLGGSLEPLIGFLSEERQLSDKERQELMQLIENSKSDSSGEVDHDDVQ